MNRGAACGIVVRSTSSSASVDVLEVDEVDEVEVGFGGGAAFLIAFLTIGG